MKPKVRKVLIYKLGSGGFRFALIEEQWQPDHWQVVKDDDGNLIMYDFPSLEDANQFCNESVLVANKLVELSK